MGKQELEVVLPRPAPCQCGKTMRPTMAKRYDATKALGLPVIVAGEVPGMVCDACNTFAVAGAALQHLSRRVVKELMRLGRRLAGDEAKFLRKEALGVSQAALAERLGLSRETVARWEASPTLNADRDYALRAHILGVLIEDTEPDELVELAATLLLTARSEEAPARRAPMEFAA